MSKLTVDECKRIISKGRKQLTAAEKRIAELEAENNALRNQNYIMVTADRFVTLVNEFEAKDERIKELEGELVRAMSHSCDGSDGRCGEG